MPHYASDPFTGLQILSDDALSSLGSMESVDWEESKAPEQIWPGLLLATGFAGLAILFHRALIQPMSIQLGASVLALLVGLGFRQFFKNADRFLSGCRWVVSKLIPVAVIALGAGLSLSTLATGGLRWLLIVLAVIAISFGAAIFFGKCFGLSRSSSLLIGAGTGICGSSAILAVAPLLDSEDDDIVMSITAINLIGLIAMAVCIGFVSIFPMEADWYGAWTGATIHAVPTVAAAAFDHSDQAGQTATLVKLMRVAMLAPLVFGFALMRGQSQKKNGTKVKGNSLKLIPFFVWGFVALAILNTIGLLPDLHFPGQDGHVFSEDQSIAMGSALSQIGKWILTVAMAAIGIQVTLSSLFRVGGKTILVAFLTWLVLTVAILGLIQLIS